MRGVLPTIVGRTEILRMRRCISAKCIIGSCAVHAYVPDSRFVRTRNPDTRVCESLIRTKKGTKATKERMRMDNSCESRGLCLSLSHCHRYTPCCVFACKTDIRCISVLVLELILNTLIKLLISDVNGIRNRTME